MSVPAEWACTELAELLIALESGSRPRGGVKGITDGVPSLGGEHLNPNGGFRTENIRFVPGDFASNQKRGWIQAGDILVVKDGATTGKTSYVGPSFPYERALLNEHVFRCQVVSGIESKYVFYWLFSAKGHQQILADFRGAAQGGISQGFVTCVEVPVAPTNEQRRIVEAIESYFTRLDDAVATLERVQRNLKRYRASVLKAAVEGRLVPTEAELARTEDRDYEPASVLLERILAERRRRWEEAELAKMKAKGKTPKNEKWKAKYKEPSLPDTSSLPTLPEGWCWATTELACSEVFLGLTSKVDYVEEGGVPLVRAKDIREGVLDFSEARHISERQHGFLTRYRRASKGDVLVSKSGSLGTCAAVETDRPFSIYESILVLKPLAGFLRQRFLLSVMRSQPVQSRLLQSQVGSTVGHINLKPFRSFPIPIAPVAEQDRIALQVDRVSALVADAVASVELNRVRCRGLRTAVLGWAFEGKLVDQDRNDEPAGILLERIMVERNATSASTKAKKPGHRKTRSTKA